jgi:hypothetical protein
MKNTKKKIVKEASKIDDAEFAKKRKRKESTRINYEHQGVNRQVTFILRLLDIEN